MGSCSAWEVAWGFPEIPMQLPMQRNARKTPHAEKRPKKLDQNKASFFLFGRLPTRKKIPVPERPFKRQKKIA
jgi:hypothetical protein